MDIDAEVRVLKGKYAGSLGRVVSSTAQRCKIKLNNGTTTGQLAHDSVETVRSEMAGSGLVSSVVNLVDQTTAKAGIYSKNVTNASCFAHFSLFARSVSLCPGTLGESKRNVEPQEASPPQDSGDSAFLKRKGSPKPCDRPSKLAKLHEPASCLLSLPEQPKAADVEMQAEEPEQLEVQVEQAQRIEAVVMEQAESKAVDSSLVRFASFLCSVLLS